MTISKSKTAAATQARIEALEAQLKQAKAKAQAISARERAKAAKQTRAEETRRKVLVGAWALNKLEQEKLLKQLDGYLTREDDRRLFGLPPRQNMENSNETSH